MKILRPLLVVIAALAQTFFPAPATAQVPDTLIHSIPAPFGTAQTGAGLGYSVAVEGGYTVVGAQHDDTGGQGSGVVKVFDSTTGALLFLIPNPSPGASDQFGVSVGISGSRVVVGANLDDTGASNAGSAYVYDLSSDTPTVPVTTLNNPSPAAEDSFGYSVAISGSRVVVGANLDDTGASNAGSAYVYDLSSGTPTVPATTLNNPSPAAGDSFGYSVAISGMRVVVGARYDDTGASNAGSAYVYDLSSGTATVPVATLNNPHPAAGDAFGYSVTISGTRVVVGAAYDDTGATDAGRAYVYDLSSGTPTVPVATLNNPSPAVDDSFGYSVAISGTRVVVGAAYKDTIRTDTGSAYVYDLGSGTPTVPVATLNNPGNGARDWFGSSVAISGTRVVVGSPSADTGATNAGSAYVYELGSGTHPVPVTTLNNPGPASIDQFGISVAISGTRMVVGAAYDDTGATDAGRAYVYELSSGTPTVPVVTLNNPSPTNDDRFGFAVAISGTRVVVGAHNDDTGATDTGSAYVYDLSSGTPTVPVATLNNPTPVVYDYFGYSVAISGTRVVVGAYFDDTAAINAGIAYVYDLNSGTPTVPVAALNNPSPTVYDSFGYSVAISGTRAVVGAYNDDTGANNAGSAYVYDLSSGTSTVPVATLNNPSPAAGDAFGYSVAISGTHAVVGAYFDDTGAGDAGSAYVYDLGSGTPTVPVATLNNPSPAAGDAFGYSVAISDTRVVVGAYFDDTGAINAGSAYVYDLSSGTPTMPVATLNNPGPAVDDSFGYSVAIDGVTVSIGTPFDDSVLADKGFAYVYAYSPLPEISVQQPVGTELTDNASTVSLGPSLIAAAAPAKTFTVSNTGNSALTGLAVAKSGVHSADFALDLGSLPASLAVGASATFSVTFTPAASGNRTATLLISGDDDAIAIFRIALTGRGLSFTADTDGDGVNDASEYQMASLGFDWQKAQPELVQTLYAHANSADLYTPSQVQTLHVGTPKLTRAGNGAFRLTLGLQRSVNLSPRTPFPFTEQGTGINAQGLLEFQFHVPDNAAFFRVENR